MDVLHIQRSERSSGPRAERTEDRRYSNGIDFQSCQPEETDDTKKKEECIERLVNKEMVTEEDMVDFINEYRELQYKETEFKLYNSNWVPSSKEEVEEFDANNKEMAKRLAKEDKTKRVEIESRWIGQRRLGRLITKRLSIIRCE
ncbi:unnamed protein product [Rhizophagus irregularis]|nr:unnamed protein product [Rhizophagus irregularis]